MQASYKMDTEIYTIKFSRSKNIFIVLFMKMNLNFSAVMKDLIAGMSLEAVRCVCGEGISMTCPEKCSEGISLGTKAR